MPTALLAAVVLLVLVGAGGVLGGVWRFATIDTGSMQPVLNPGDVAVLFSEPVANLQVGQIVAFHPPDEPKVTVIHRVVSIDRSNGAVVIVTRGDANNANDQWHSHVEGKVVWYKRARVPVVGYVTTWLQQPVVRFAVVVSIVVLVVSLSIGKVWRRTPADSIQP
jgi:signal peptidase